MTHLYNVLVGEFRVWALVSLGLLAHLLRWSVSPSYPTQPPNRNGGGPGALGYVEYG